MNRTKPRKVDANFFFVEKKPTNFLYLKKLLGATFGDARLSSDIQLYPSSFQSVLSNIIARIKARRGGERAIFLLDQYAYDQVPLEMLRVIFSSLAGAEVLLTFNIDSLITFLADNDASRKKLQELGLAQYVDWTTLRTLKDKSDPRWRTLIQRQLAMGILQESGAAFSTIFFVTPAASPGWTYWLIHLSNVFKARDVMMELHWGHANHFSHFLEPDIFTLGHTAGRGAKLVDQTDLDLGENFNFDAVAASRCCQGLSEKLLPRIYELERVTFADLLITLGNSTPATAEMVKNALDPAIKSGELEVISRHGAFREMGATIHSSDVIQRAPQHHFSFPK